MPWYVKPIFYAKIQNLVNDDIQNLVNDDISNKI